MFPANLALSVETFVTEVVLSCVGKWADIAWTGNWTSFLDTLLQTSILCTTQRNLALPVDFERIVIDPIEFLKHIKEPEEGQERELRNKLRPYRKF